MSPSWLDVLSPRLTLALLDDTHAWQQRMLRKTEHWTAASPYVQNEQQLTEALDTVLDAAPTPLPHGTRINLLLPDSQARYCLLPWSPEIATPEELRQYAIEHFEMAGHSVRENWQVHADWRGEANALAYAVPHALLDAIGKHLHARALRLCRAVPLTAAVHYHRLCQPRGNAWYVIRSNRSLNALSYRHGKLLVQQTEPIRGDVETALARLFARLRIASHIALPERIAFSGIAPAAIERLCGEVVPTVTPLNLLAVGAG